ncbi:hydrolase [Rhodohalobacter sp. SW132]|uniref:carbohydrate binding family 9 domain-containing protein n=1 Tax=Rhodohalobacter sp. SW132 TaxID=2293433 RepID=UPI000E264BEA|nr:carbohydrate binding family 9 domain-containing protein [Rhodohalobacter sp. SW132]REL24640.1 hydrolase [Rhodohalobacter sp. SW132]
MNKMIMVLWSSKIILSQVLAIIIFGALDLTKADAQNNQERKEIRAYQLESSDHFRFDGRVDEEFWNQIEPATDFLQQEPSEGAPATENTEVRIAYDSEYLYIAVILFDSDPAGIKATQRRRDSRLVADERFTWIIDTFDDQRSAYFMEINPNGLRTDGLITTGQGSSINLNWDGIWDARAVIGDFGWSAEIRIPFRTFNFNPDSDRWGINFMRVVRRKSETSLWSGHLRSQGIDRPQNAGVLTGLSGMSQGLGLEVVPFGVFNGNEERFTGETNRATNIDGGFDVNYSITPRLRASVTVNTDFAEAEVDQRQVNLTRFPLMFPERRDFFLEGSNIYEFAPASRVFPFFSRRIGLEGGQPVPINFGTRLLGNTGDYNLALLHVNTGGTDDLDSENFSVARIKRNLGRESTVGVIYTRRSAISGENLTADFQSRHTFGADLELGTSEFMGNKNLQFQAFFVYHNSPLAGDDQTDMWDRSTRGIRLNFPNQPWSGLVSYREFGNAFDPAVGFTQRNAFRRLNPQISYSPQFSGSDLIRQVEWGIWYEHLMDLDFNLLTQDLRLTLFEIDFMSDDQLSFEVTRNFEWLVEPFDIRRDGSIIIPPDEYVNWYINAEFETASYRAVALELEYETGGFWSGTRSQYGAELSIRPITGIEFNPEYIRTDVRLDEGNFSADLFRFTANLDFTTSLFITTTVQYDNLSQLLATNNRLRWIITPGSDLFLVYNHNWLEDDSRFNTLQRSGTVKLSYTHRF